MTGRWPNGDRLAALRALLATSRSCHRSALLRSRGRLLFPPPVTTPSAPQPPPIWWRRQPSAGVLRGSRRGLHPTADPLVVSRSVSRVGTGCHWQPLVSSLPASGPEFQSFIGVGPSILMLCHQDVLRPSSLLKSFSRTDGINSSTGSSQFETSLRLGQVELTACCVGDIRPTL